MSKLFKKKMIIIRSIPCMQSYLKNKRFVFFFLCWELCLEINDGLAYYCHLHLIWNLKLDCLHFCSQTYKYLIHFRALIWNIEMIKLWIIYRYKIIYIKCMLIKEKYLLLLEFAYIYISCLSRFDENILLCKLYILNGLGIRHCIMYQ